MIQAGTETFARHHFETKSQGKKNDIKQMISRI